MGKSTKSTPIKKERDKTKRLKALFLERYFKFTGNVSELCRQLKIDRGTYYLWMKKDKEFNQAIKDEQEGLIDFVESKLFNLINGKNPTAIIFFLKTKGKSRGYVERVEQQIQGDEFHPLKVIISNDGDK